MDDAIGNLNGKIGMGTALPQAPVGMDDNEWEARLDLAACYRMVAHYGWTSVVYNHITLRIPGTDKFLINPFGYVMTKFQQVI